MPPGRRSSKDSLLRAGYNTRMPSPSTIFDNNEETAGIPFTNPPYTYKDGDLYCESTDLRTIATEVGTPCYVYAANGILERYRAYDQAFGDLPHRICFAVKANSNLSVLRLLANAGAGFDIVSAGELYRVLEAGGDPAKVVFSGVGKTVEEMRFALEKGIHSFNCESAPELETLARVARDLGVTARVSLRVNPDVDARTHPYISTGLREHKFGVGMEEAFTLYQLFQAEPGLQWVGVSCHIGSQMLDVSPIAEASEKMRASTSKNWISAADWVFATSPARRLPEFRTMARRCWGFCAMPA
jgi:diaminopimelate decarboxylase